MQKYRKMFVEAAREHLALAGQQLVALEKAPGDAERINELFRNAHSIKGMSASLGYEEISALAHSLEDLLDLVRSGKRDLDPSRIDLLLRTIDVLDQMVSQVEAESPLVDVTPFLSEIQALLTDAPAPPVAARNSAPATTRAPGQNDLRVNFRVTADSVSPGARGFLAVRTLEQLGTVRNLRPEIDVIKSGRYGRIVDADLNSDCAAGDVAGKLAAISEIADVRVVEAGEGAGQAPVASVRPSSRPETPATAVTAPAAGQPASVRVRVESLDRFVDAVGELILNKSELREIARDLDSEALHQGLSRLEASLEELNRQAMSIRLTPLERVLGTLPRIVRDVSRMRGKEVHLEIRGNELELDRAVVDSLSKPLIHLVRNALDHGIESPSDRESSGKERQGRLLVEAYREKDIAVIHVEDDGRGVEVNRVRAAALRKGFLDEGAAQALDEESVLALMFLPGMSTATEVSEISGRGVGLDAVKSIVQGLGGTVSARTKAGQGTQFTLRIPFSAAILRALIVRVGEEVFAIPIPKLHRALEVQSEDLLDGARSGGAPQFCRFEGGLVPARSLAGLLGVDASDGMEAAEGAAWQVVVADTRAGRTALLVDAFVGEEEVFVKQLGRPLSALECLSGITVLGNGRPVFVLDPYGLEAVVPAEALNSPQHQAGDVS